MANILSSKQIKIRIAQIQIYSNFYTGVLSFFFLARLGDQPLSAHDSW